MTPFKSKEHRPESGVNVIEAPSAISASTHTPQDIMLLIDVGNDNEPPKKEEPNASEYADNRFSSPSPSGTIETTIRPSIHSQHILAVGDADQGIVDGRDFETINKEISTRVDESKKEQIDKTPIITEILAAETLNSPPTSRKIDLIVPVTNNRVEELDDYIPELQHVSSLMSCKSRVETSPTPSELELLGASRESNTYTSMVSQPSGKADEDESHEEQLAAANPIASRTAAGEDFAWTAGGDPAIAHVMKIGYRDFSEIHKVPFDY